MRELILKRIEEISERENGFSKALMRWQNYSVNNVHISEVRFQNLTEESLLKEFERLVTRCSKQM